MSSFCLFSNIFLTLNFIFGQVNGRIFHFHMPNVVPTEETYYCTPHMLPFNDHEYLVEFSPNASMSVAHHILIYGCEDPGYYERDTPHVVWDCGEMSGSSNNLIRAPVCSGKSKIIYAWAMDAPRLKLPNGVGFKVGGDTGINFLVLQVHYGINPKFETGNLMDSSGIDITVLSSDTKLVTKRAGVLLLGTAGIVPPGLIHMEVAGEITEKIRMYPFAFRTHTHKLGKVVSGWRVRRNGIESDEEMFKLIGKHNPQEPQMFYPIKDKMIIETGDIVAARCTMNNTRNEIVKIGSTGKDEMCNFYMMYYVDGEDILDSDSIFSYGPPNYYWKYDTLMPPIPKKVDIEASTL